MIGNLLHESRDENRIRDCSSTHYTDATCRMCCSQLAMQHSCEAGIEQQDAGSGTELHFQLGCERDPPGETSEFVQCQIKTSGGQECCATKRRGCAVQHYICRMI